MASTTTVTLSDLIDECLSVLYRATERPMRIVIGANDLTSVSDTTFTLTEGSSSVQSTGLVEFGAELMLVTAKSSDSNPIFTVARGYLSSTPAVVVNGTAGTLNPSYPRRDVRRAIERGVKAMESLVPCVTSGVFQRAADRQYVEMPSDTVDVFELGHLNDISGRYDPISGWEFFEDMPASKVATGKIIRVPSVIGDDDELIVKYQAPYAWSDASETATLAIPLGAEDLPIMWATARLISGREVTRSEIDKVEEWNHEAAIRGGINLRQVRDLWSEYYRRLDEVRRVQNVPKNRPYRKMSRFVS